MVLVLAHSSASLLVCFQLQAKHDVQPIGLNLRMIDKLRVIPIIINVLVLEPVKSVGQFLCLRINKCGNFRHDYNALRVCFAFVVLPRIFELSIPWMSLVSQIVSHPGGFGMVMYTEITGAVSPAKKRSLPLIEKDSPTHSTTTFETYLIGKAQKRSISCRRQDHNR